MPPRCCIPKVTMGLIQSRISQNRSKTGFFPISWLCFILVLYWESWHPLQIFLMSPCLMKFRYNPLFFYFFYKAFPLLGKLFM